MLTQNEMTGAVVEVYEDRARLAAKIVETEAKIVAVYKRFGDKLGCLPNYPAVDAAIDAVVAENKRLASGVTLVIEGAVSGKVDEAFAEKVALAIKAVT